MLVVWIALDLDLIRFPLTVQTGSKPNNLTQGSFSCSFSIFLKKRKRTKRKEPGVPGVLCAFLGGSKKTGPFFAVGVSGGRGGARWAPGTAATRTRRGPRARPLTPEVPVLGPPAIGASFLNPLFWVGRVPFRSPRIDYKRKAGTLIPTSLQEDLVKGRSGTW